MYRIIYVNSATGNHTWKKISLWDITISNSPCIVWIQFLFSRFLSPRCVAKNLVPGWPECAYSRWDNPNSVKSLTNNKLCYPSHYHRYPHHIIYLIYPLNRRCWHLSCETKLQLVLARSSEINKIILQKRRRHCLDGLWDNAAKGLRINYKEYLSIRKSRVINELNKKKKKRKSRV